jgi:hypothetical protein
MILELVEFKKDDSEVLTGVVSNHELSTNSGMVINIVPRDSIFSFCIVASKTIGFHFSSLFRKSTRNCLVVESSFLPSKRFVSKKDIVSSGLMDLSILQGILGENEAEVIG